MKLSDKIKAAIDKACEYYDNAAEFLAHLNDLDRTAVNYLSEVLVETGLYYDLCLISCEDEYMIEVTLNIPSQVFNHPYTLLLDANWQPHYYSLQELIQKLLTFEKRAKEVLAKLDTLQ